MQEHIIASTSEVYGKSEAIPFREDQDLVIGATTCGQWSYACSKALDEFLGLAYYREKDVPVTIVRLFNTVGPRQTGQYGMVVPTLIRQALLGQPMTVFGTGNQSRCFCYVGDVVEALVRIARNPSVVGQVLNVGNNCEISIRGLAEMIKQRTGSLSEIIYVAYEDAYGPGFEDMFRRVPSLEKLQRFIHYRPSTPLEAIIEVVGSDMREQLRGLASAAVA